MTDNHVLRGDFSVKLTDMATGDAGVAYARLHLYDDEDGGPFEATGRSWRSQEDAPNPRVGRRLAIARALDRLARQLHREAWQEIHDDTHGKNEHAVQPNQTDQDPYVIAIDVSGSMAQEGSNGKNAVTTAIERAQNMIKSNPNATVIAFNFGMAELIQTPGYAHRDWDFVERKVGGGSSLFPLKKYLIQHNLTDVPIHILSDGALPLDDASKNLPNLFLHDVTQATSTKIEP